MLQSVMRSHRYLLDLLPRIRRYEVSGLQASVTVVGFTVCAIRLTFLLVDTVDSRPAQGRLVKMEHASTGCKTIKMVCSNDFTLVTCSLEHCRFPLNEIRRYATPTTDLTPFNLAGNRASPYLQHTDHLYLISCHCRLSHNALYTRHAPAPPP